LVDGQEDHLNAYPFTLPDGRTTYLSRSGATSTRTDAAGHFEVAGVRPGSVPLGVVAPGYAAWRGSVAAAAGETGTETITLAAGFRVTGSVRDAAGNPAAGCVFAFSQALSSELSLFVMTGPDGMFELDDIAPGEIRLEVGADEGGAWTTLTGQAGETLTWDALLGPESPDDAFVEEPHPWGE